ncbi:phosphatase PAP2 family protein [Maribacter sp.]|uniref:phosphatase PAP2 family protein n=1 Tax=Maribacter sp. TaxID=1897614 RepID=UPI0025C182D6|nr:phosphatase PAP2 family protein [Maribacter sp.]
MIKKVLLGIFLLSALFAKSQQIKTDLEDSRWQMFTYDFGNIFKGVGYSYARPLHWKGDQWATVGYTLAGTSLLHLVDKPVSDSFIAIKEDVPKGISEYGFNVGSPSNNYLITGAIYVTGLALKDEKLRRTGVLLIASATSAGFLQQVVKSVVGRARPLSGKSKDTFKPFWGGSKKYHSFPSGHAILAMTNAHAIAKQFKNPWVKTGVYTLGSIPAVSRLWEGKHWLSDVALGVAISIFTVESIDRYLDSRYNQKYNEGSKKISWNLNFAPGQIGVVGRF